jgi:hypothetical protein
MSQLLRIHAILLSIIVFSISGCSQKDDENVVQWKTDETCNLHEQSCTTENGSASVSIEVMPKPIPIARPLQVEVELKGLKAEKVELDISGVNMYMGFNRVELKPETSKSVYTGTSMLAFCTLQKMTWQLTVMIYQTDGTQIQVPYTLETINKI